MSHYTEEFIFSYIDQVLTPEQVVEFEQELSRNPELKSRVDQLKRAHQYFMGNQLETAPESLPDQVLSLIHI